MNNLHKNRAWIELDRTALRHNINQLEKLLPPGCQLMPAVKANAYGHGAALIARECQAAGITAFCVASLDEGVELREAGITGKILILGCTPSQLAPLLHKFRLTQTITDFACARDLNSFGRPVDVHIKIDTGMHRLGFRWDRPDEIREVFRFPNLRVTGAFTHLCAEEIAEEQGRRFHEAVARLRAQDCPLPSVHFLASKGLLFHPEMGGDYARVGIALYGLLETREDMERCPVFLKPVLSLKARVAQVRALPAGGSAGYGLAFTAQQPSKIAVLTIGYADGLPRSLSCGTGKVLIRGQEAPIVGRVCMDQTLVDVTGIPEAAPWDEAVLIGRSGSLEITAMDMAKQAGTIANEIVSRLGNRVERGWKQDKK